MSKPLELPSESGKGWAIVNWFTYFSFDDGLISCRFEKALKPYLIDIQGRMILGDIRHLLPMKSSYSKRVYLLLKEYAKFGVRKFNIEELMNILKVPKSLLRYSQFKQKVLNTRIPPPPAEEARIYLQRLAREEAVKYDKVRVGFSFHMRSPEERSLAKLRKKMEEERKRSLIVKKFNENNIGQLTGLKGDELRSFMNYCRFPEDFLLYSSEYDILEAVKRIYKKYYRDLDLR
jgi:plasmid replication initiation protein